MGVTMVQNRESSLSVPGEWVDFGLKYVTEADPKNKNTTSKWEEQVEKAFAHPVAVGNLRMVAMILLQDVSTSIKGSAATTITTTQTDNSCTEVSPQASLRIGGMSQKKWLILLE